MSRRRLLLIIIVVVVTLILGISLNVYLHHKSAGYATVTVNKDTGQTIVNYPNQTPETGGVKNYVTIFGANKLINAGMTQAQFSLAEQLITNYVNKQLHGSYNQVSILNDGFSSDGTSASGKLRLGTTNILLNINISFNNLTNVSVNITGPNNNSYYAYQSGVQTAPGD